jgi:D-3-phosphoglycerate dehydrogenase / 2-oxoglutarate reductase
MKILVMSPIDNGSLELLNREHDVALAVGVGETSLTRLAGDREVFIFRSGVEVSEQLMRSAPNLRLIVRAGSGFDNVDVANAQRQGIRLMNIPGPSAQSVAELTFGLMLDLARKISLADRLVREGRWPKHELLGHVLYGKTVGIVGAGNIGSRVGELAAAWGMRAIGCVEYPGAGVAEKLLGKGIELADLDDVLRAGDFVTINLPLQESTVDLIDRRALSLMKPGSFLINVARGGIVEEEALYKELTMPGRIAGAALDVHAHEGDGEISPFADLPNVVLTPHIGSMTAECQEEIGERLMRIVGAFARGELEAEARNGELLL